MNFSRVSTNLVLSDLVSLDINNSFYCILVCIINLEFCISYHVISFCKCIRLNLQSCLVFRTDYSFNRLIIRFIKGSSPNLGHGVSIIEVKTINRSQNLLEIVCIVCICDSWKNTRFYVNCTKPAYFTPTKRFGEDCSYLYARDRW